MLAGMGNDFLPSCSDVLIDEAVGSRNVIYRLGESEMFNFANTNTMVNGLKLVDVIPRMVVEDHGFIHLEPDKFTKDTKFELFDSSRFKISCKPKLIEMLKSGKLVMVYSNEYNVPVSIPYIAQANKSKSKVFFNVTDFVELNSYGQIEITNQRNYNAFMAILVAAAVAYVLITSMSAIPADLGDGIILTYSNMLERVINSLVHLDPVSRDKVRYLATEFALIQMYGTETGTERFHRVKLNYFPKLTKMVTESIDNQFRTDSFDKLSLFIDELKRLYPSMKMLTEYMVYDKWIRTYGAATAMAIDYIGYHIYTICMVLMESPLINRMALEPIMEKNRGVDMYKRIQSMILNAN